MLAVLVCGSANATVISTYTDRSAWETALAGLSFHEETFDGAASSFIANSSANPAGAVTVDLLGGVIDPGPSGLTGSGYFQSEVDDSLIDSTHDGLSLSFNHASATGFGLLGLQNDSATNPAGLNLVEISLLVGGDYFLVTDLLGLTDSSTATGELGSQLSGAAVPFIGFILDHAVTEFGVVHSNRVRAGIVSTTSEEFYLDGLVFASSRTGLARQFSVPEPGSLLLMLVGFVGLFMNKALRLTNR